MIGIDGKITTHQQTIAENFNYYYVSVADNISNNNPLNNNNVDLNKINPSDYYILCFNNLFQKLKWKIYVLVK